MTAEWRSLWPDPHDTADGILCWGATLSRLGCTKGLMCCFTKVPPKHRCRAHCVVFRTEPFIGIHQKNRLIRRNFKIAEQELTNQFLTASTGIYFLRKQGLCVERVVSGEEVAVASQLIIGIYGLAGNRIPFPLQFFQKVLVPLCLGNTVPERHHHNPFCKGWVIVLRQERVVGAHHQFASEAKFGIGTVLSVGLH